MFGLHAVGAAPISATDSIPLGPYSAALRGQASKNGTGQGVTPTFSAFTPNEGSALVAVVWVDGAQGDFGGAMGNAAGAGNDGWTKVHNYESFLGTWSAFVLPYASAVSTQPQFSFAGTAGYPSILVFECAGLGDYLDGVSLTTFSPGTGPDDMASGPTGTLASQPAAVLGVVYQTTGIDTPSAGTGFTSLGTAWDYEGSQAVSVRVEHQHVTSTDPVEATGGQASNRNSMVMTLAFAAGPLADDGGDDTAAAVAYTEGDDTAAATAATGIAATLARTEADDTLTAEVDTAIAATLAVTEADDTVAAATTSPRSASATYTEADDTAASAAATGIQAGAAVAEGDDTLAASCIVSAGLATAYTEADDTVAATAIAAVGVTAAITEADDTVAATSTEPITVSAAIQEAPDTLASQAATLVVVVQAAYTEADDGVMALAAAAISGSVQAQEMSDAFAAEARVGVGVALAITEDDDELEAEAEIMDRPRMGAVCVTVEQPRQALVSTSRPLRVALSTEEVARVAVWTQTGPCCGRH